MSPFPAFLKRPLWPALLAIFFLPALSPARADEVGATASVAEPASGGFQHRGFYLHGCWRMEYPFAVRSWTPADYHGMFLLLRSIGFDTVMLWPVVEAAPMPLSAEDAQAIREFRPILADARTAGLETWLTLCANLVSTPEIAAVPWKERNFYPFMQTVRLDDPAQAAPYLAHRSAILQILNNADGYVTIDGDPGGYAGAKPEDFLKVFLADRATLDRYGERPKAQKLIPWIWCGWGTKAVWAEPIAPYVRASLEVLKEKMPEPWEMLPGRSIADGHANGRINVGETLHAGLGSRSMLMCYEAIEFEPTPPAIVLQFDEIRRIFREEAGNAANFLGVMGNAQQPICAIQNLFFFARGAASFAYLQKSDDEVLHDLATYLGGPPELLVPAWASLSLGTDRLPADLPARLRAATLHGEPAGWLPGGAERYVQILAAQVDARLSVLRAISSPKAGPETPALVAEAMESMIRWWQMSRYVVDGNGSEAFGWQYVHPRLYGPLQEWCAKELPAATAAIPEISKRIAESKLLPEDQATARVKELLRQ